MVDTPPDILPPDVPADNPDYVMPSKQRKAVEKTIFDDGQSEQPLGNRV